MAFPTLRISIMVCLIRPGRILMAWRDLALSLSAGIGCWRLAGYVSGEMILNLRAFPASARLRPSCGAVLTGCYEEIGLSAVLGQGTLLMFKSAAWRYLPC